LDKRVVDWIDVGVVEEGGVALLHLGAHLALLGECEDK
jgi:hypothetical protein